MRKVTLAAMTALMFSTLGPVTIRSQVGAQKEKSETVKIRASEVIVDAVVSDRKNRLITNLTPQDFEIYEDGVLQEITSFDIIRGGAERSTPALKSGKPAEISNSQASAVEAAAPATREMPPHLTILLLDYSTTQMEHKKLVQDSSIKYVEQKLQPNDLMAVFLLGSGL